MTHTNQFPTTELLDGITTWETQQLQQALETIRGELHNRTDADSITILWQVDDVQAQRPDLTTAQCQEVLKALDHYHDASIGINWDVIDCVADECFPAPHNLAELREQAE
jgi:hypothetical protein